jgi:cation diffusion facilitator CzcD-associated flavoprotein CzcO
MDIRKTRRVGIIGAGVAGLATARQLIARGIECTIFERADRLGGVWAAGYTGFGAQVQKELYEFPDYPLPEEAPGFTPGKVIQQYLEAYAGHFGVWSNIRFGTTVTEVRESADGTGRWVVAWEGSGDRSEVAFDLIVVAIGLFSNKPRLPHFP